MTASATAAIAALAMVGCGHDEQSILEIIILAGYRLDCILRFVDWTVSFQNCNPTYELRN
jgi:hypothetical protein